MRGPVCHLLPPPPPPPRRGCLLRRRGPGADVGPARQVCGQHHPTFKCVKPGEDTRGGGQVSMTGIVERFVHMNHESLVSFFRCAHAAPALRCTSLERAVVDTQPGRTPA